MLVWWKVTTLSPSPVLSTMIPTSLENQNWALDVTKAPKAQSSHAKRQALFLGIAPRGPVDLDVHNPTSRLLLLREQLYSELLQLVCTISYYCTILYCTLLYFTIAYTIYDILPYKIYYTLHTIHCTILYITMR